MMKKYRVLKWLIIVFFGLLISIAAFVFWFMSQIPSGAERQMLSKTSPKDLPYLAYQNEPSRGKILAVVTSHDEMGTSGKLTGYELTELARAYYVFTANNFVVDIASPKGGKPPVIIDWEDMGAFDFAFLNDSIAQFKTSHTIHLNNVVEENYKAVYFVGGKGAMYDFPDNKKIQAIINNYDQKNKVIGAVCHGPAALVNVIDDNGTPFVSNKTLCGFTNIEELFLIPDAESIFPFLLEDKLIAQGANFKEGKMYLKNVMRDGNLITGQNPWSTWAVADSIISQIGYSPKLREHTAEENTIEILSIYTDSGYTAAKKRISKFLDQQKKVDPLLLAMHTIVEAMQWNFTDCTNKLRLLVYTNQNQKL